MAEPTQPSQSAEVQSTAIELPHPRSKKSPRFTGKSSDLHDFLFDFQVLIERHHLTEEECFFHIARYVVPSVRDTIEGMVEYQEYQEDSKTPRSWNTFLKAFRDIYDYAKAERKYTIKDLTRFIEKTGHSPKFTSISDFTRYKRRFLRIAGWLAARKKIDLDTNHRSFWLGIPKPTRKKLETRILQMNPSIDRTTPYTFFDITGAAEHIFDVTVFYEPYATDSDEEEEEKSTRKAKGKKRKYDTDSDSEVESSDSGDDDTESEDVVSIRKYQRKEKQKREKEKEKEREKEKEKGKEKGREKEKEKEKRPKKTSQTKTPQYLEPTQDMDVDDMDEIPGLIGKLQNMRLDDPAYAGTWFTIIRRAPDMKDYLDPPPRRAAPALTPRPITPAPSAPPPSYACYFCGEQGHGTRRCPKADEMVAAGKISRTDQGRIAWLDGTMISRNRDETLFAAVQRQLNPIPIKRTNLIFATSPPTQQGSDSDVSYTEDCSEGYVCHVRKANPVARAQDARKAERQQVRFEGVFPPRRPVKMGVPGEKTNPSAPQTTVQPQPTPPAVDTGKTQATITELRPQDPYDSDEIMEDIEHIEAPHHRAKASRPQVTKAANPNQKERKSEAPKMQTSLGRQVDVNTLVKKVLGTPLSISLGDFLGSSPHCSKIIKEYLTVTRPTTLASAEKAPVGKANLISNPSDSHPLDTHRLHTQHDDRPTVLIQLKVSFDNGVTTKALIDPGSEMDMINVETWMAMQTPMDPSAKLVMEDAGSHLLPMQGVCRNVKMKTGDLSTTADLWVARIEFPLVLGRPWQIRNKISIEEKKSGTWLCRRGPGDTKLWQICALPAKNAAPFLNLTGDHPGNPITLDDYFHHSPPPQQVFQMRKHDPDPNRIRNQGQDPDNPILVEDSPPPDLPFPDDGYMTEQGDLSDEE